MDPSTFEMKSLKRSDGSFEKHSNKVHHHILLFRATLQLETQAALLQTEIASFNSLGLVLRSCALVKIRQELLYIVLTHELHFT